MCELARGFFTWTQFAELEPGAEAAGPAGTVRPLCGLLSWNINKDVISSTQHSELAYQFGGSHVYVFVMPFCSGVYAKERSVGWETDLANGREGFSGRRIIW